MNYDYDDNFNFNDILSPIKSPYQQYVEENTCSYCKANGMAKFEGHTKKNCPEIAALSPCPLCGANGMENHTPNHCPKRPRIQLQLKQPLVNYDSSGDDEAMDEDVEALPSPAAGSVNDVQQLPTPGFEHKLQLLSPSYEKTSPQAFNRDRFTFDLDHQISEKFIFRSGYVIPQTPTTNARQQNHRLPTLGFVATASSSSWNNNYQYGRNYAASRSELLETPLKMTDIPQKPSGSRRRLF